MRSRAAPIATLRVRVPAARTLVVAEAAWPELAPLPAARRRACGRGHARSRSLCGAADFCLLLDDVQDPGNVGSILRSAAAAGVAQVLLSKQCAFAWSPKVLRAGQGAHFYLEIFEDVDLAAWARSYRGRTLAAVAQGGDRTLCDRSVRALALAIGNEGAGLSAPLRGRGKPGASPFPMPGGSESLNAAAAAAICLFECVRQRRR